MGFLRESLRGVFEQVSHLVLGTDLFKASPGDSLQDSVGGFFKRPFKCLVFEDTPRDVRRDAQSKLEESSQRVFLESLHGEYTQRVYVESLLRESA